MLEANHTCFPPTADYDYGNVKYVLLSKKKNQYVTLRVCGILARPYFVYVLLKNKGIIILIWCSILIKDTAGRIRMALI